MVFDYDWWHGDGMNRQLTEAKRRAALSTLSHARHDGGRATSEYARFMPISKRG